MIKKKQTAKWFHKEKKIIQIPDLIRKEEIPMVWTGSNGVKIFLETKNNCLLLLNLFTMINKYIVSLHKRQHVCGK